MIIIKIAKGIKTLNSIALKPHKILVWQLLDSFTACHLVGLGWGTWLRRQVPANIFQWNVSTHGEPELRLAMTLSMSKCHVYNLQFVMSEQSWTLKPMHCQLSIFKERTLRLVVVTQSGCTSPIPAIPEPAILVKLKGNQATFALICSILNLKGIARKLNVVIFMDLRSATSAWNN